MKRVFTSKALSILFVLMMLGTAALKATPIENFSDHSTLPANTRGVGGTITVTPTTVPTAFDFGEVAFGSASTPMVFTVQGEGLDATRQFSYAELAVLMQNGYSASSDRVQFIFVSDFEEKFHKIGNPMTFTDPAAEALYDAFFTDAFDLAKERLPITTVDELYDYYVTGLELMNGIDVSIYYTPSHTNPFDEEFANLKVDNVSDVTIPAAILPIYTDYPQMNNFEFHVTGHPAPSSITVTPSTAGTSYDFGTVAFGSSSAPQTFTIQGVNLDPARKFSYAELAVLMQDGYAASTDRVQFTFVSDFEDKFHHTSQMTFHDPIVAAMYDALFTAALPYAQERLNVTTVDDLYYYYVTGAELMAGIDVTIYYTPSHTNPFDEEYANLKVANVEDVAVPAEILPLYYGYPEMIDFEINVTGTPAASSITVTPSTAGTSYDFGTVAFGSSSAPQTFTIQGVNLDPARKFSYAELAVLMQDGYAASTDRVQFTFVSDFEDKFEHTSQMTFHDPIVAAMYDALFTAALPYAQERLDVTTVDELYYYYVTGAELMAGIDVTIYYTPSHTNPFDEEYANLKVANVEDVAVPAEILSLYYGYPEMIDFEINVTGTPAASSITVTPTSTQDDPEDFGAIAFGTTSAPKYFTVKGVNLDPNRKFSYAELAVLMRDGYKGSSDNIEAIFISDFDEKFHHTSPMVISDPILAAMYDGLFNEAFSYAQERLPIATVDDLYRYYVTGAELMAGINVEIKYKPSTTIPKLEYAYLKVSDVSEVDIPSAIEQIYYGYPKMENFGFYVTGHAEASFVTVLPNTFTTDPYDFGSVPFGSTSAPKTFRVKGEFLDPARQFSYVELAYLMQDGYAASSDGVQVIFDSDFENQFKHTSQMTITDPDVAAMYEGLFNAAFDLAKERLDIATVDELYYYYVTGQELMDTIDVTITYTPSNTAQEVEYAFLKVADPTEVTIPAEIAPLYIGYPQFVDFAINVKGMPAESNITVTPTTTVADMYDFGTVAYGSTSATQIFTVKGTNLDPARKFSYAELAVLMQDGYAASTDRVQFTFVSDFENKFEHTSPMTFSDPVVAAMYDALFTAALPYAQERLDVTTVDELYNYYVTGAELMAGIDVAIYYTPSHTNAGEVEYAHLKVDNVEDVIIPSEIQQLYYGYPKMNNFEFHVQGTPAASNITVTPATTVAARHDFGEVAYGSTSASQVFQVKGTNLDPARKFSYAELAFLMQDGYDASSANIEAIFVSDFESKFFHITPMAVDPIYQGLFEAALTLAQERLPITTWNELANYYVTGAELMAGIDVTIYYKPSTTETILEYADLRVADVSELTIPAEIASIYAGYPTMVNFEFHVQGTPAASNITVTPATTVAAPHDFGAVTYGTTSAPVIFTVKGTNLDPARKFTYAELAVLMKDSYDGSSANIEDIFISDFDTKFFHTSPMVVSNPTIAAMYDALFTAALPLAQERLPITTAGELYNYYVTGAELMAGINVEISYKPSNNYPTPEYAYLKVANVADVDINPAIAALYEGYPTMDGFEFNVIGHPAGKFISVTPITTKADPYDFGPVVYGTTSAPQTFVVKGEMLDPAQQFSYAELAFLMQDGYEASSANIEDIFISDFESKFLKGSFMTITDPTLAAIYDGLFNEAFPLAQERLDIATVDDLYKYYVTGAELMAGINVEIRYKPSSSYPTEEYAFLKVSDPTEVTIPAEIAPIYADYPLMINFAFNVTGHAKASFITVEPTTTPAAPYDFGEVVYGNTSDVKIFTIRGEDLNPAQKFSYAELAVLMEGSFGNDQIFVNNYANQFFHSEAMDITPVYQELFENAFAMAQERLPITTWDNLANYYVTGQELMDGIDISISYHPIVGLSNEVDAARVVIADPSTVTIPAEIAAIYTGYPIIMDLDINVIGQPSGAAITVTPTTTPATPYDFGEVIYGNTSPAKVFTVKGVNIDPTRNFSYAELAVLMEGSFGNNDIFINNYEDKFRKTTSMDITPVYQVLFENAFALAQERLPIATWQELADYYVTGAELLAGIDVEIQYHPIVGVSGATDVARVVVADPSTVTIPAVIAPIYVNYPKMVDFDINVIGRPKGAMITVTPATTQVAPYDFGAVPYGSTSAPMTFTVYGENLVPTQVFSYAELAVLMKDNYLGSSANIEDIFVNNLEAKFFHIAPMDVDLAHQALFMAAFDLAAERLPITAWTDLANYYVTGQELLDGIDITITYTPSSTYPATEFAFLKVADPSEVVIDPAIASIYSNYPTMENFEINVIGHPEGARITVAPLTTPATPYDFGAVLYGTVSAPTTFVITGENLDPAQKFTYAELAVLMGESFGDEDVFINNYVDVFKKITPMTITPIYQTLFENAFALAQERLPITTWEELARYYVTGAELMAGININISYSPSVNDPTVVDVARVVVADPSTVTIPAAIADIYDGYPAIVDFDINVIGHADGAFITVTPTTTPAAPYDFGGVIFGKTSQPTTFTIKGESLNPTQQFSYAELAVLMGSSFGNDNVFISNYEEQFFHITPMVITPIYQTLFENAFTLAAERLDIDVWEDLANYYVTGAELMAGIDVEIRYTPSVNDPDVVDVARVVIEDPRTAIIPAVIASIYDGYPLIKDLDINVIGHAITTYITATPNDAAQIYNFGEFYLGETSDVRTYTIQAGGINPLKKISYAELAVLMSDYSFGNDNIFLTNYDEKFFHYQPMEITPVYQVLFENAFTLAAERLPIQSWEDLANYYVTGAELIRGIDVTIAYRPAVAGVRDEARVKVVDPSESAIVAANPALAAIYAGYPRIVDFDIHVEGYAKTGAVEMISDGSITFETVCFGGTANEEAINFVANGLVPGRIYSFAELYTLMSITTNFAADQHPFITNVADIFYQTSPMDVDAEYADLFTTVFPQVKDYLNIVTDDPAILAFFYVTAEELMNGITLTVGYTPTSEFANDNAQIILDNTKLPMMTIVYPGIFANYPEFEQCTITLSGSGNAPDVQFFGETVICEGQSTTLTAVDMNGLPFAWYNWQHSSENTSVITVAPTTTTTYTVDVITLSGCTATASITVQVNPTNAVAESISVCASELPYVWSQNGQAYYQSGVYTYTETTGVGSCETVYTLVLTVQQNPVVYITESDACDSYTWNGVTYTQDGVYTQVLASQAGCDSTVILVLHLNHSYTEDIYVDICEGETYEFCGQVLTTSATVPCISTTINGCDSIVNLYLTVHPTLEPIVLVPEMCEGSIYVDEDFAKLASMSYVNIAPNIIADTAYLTTSYGCDSIRILYLTVLEQAPITYLDDVNICMGDVYDFYGQQVSTTGVYTATLTASNGCDSLIRVNVTVYPIPIIIIDGEDQSICSGESTTLTARPFTGPNSNYEYTWSRVNTNGPNEVIAVDEPTISTGILTNDGNMPMTYIFIASVRHILTGCVRETNVTVTVNPLPTNAQILGPTEICEGEEINLIASGAQTYIWNNGQTGEVIAVAPTSDMTIGMRATNVFGCSTPAGTWIEHTILVNAAPAPILNAFGAPYEINLAWNDTDAERYLVYRDNALLATTQSTTFVDEQILQGLPYCYTVVAVYGACQSAPSNEVCTRTTSVPMLSGNTQGHFVSLVWNDTDAEEYMVYRDDALIATTATINYVDEQVTEGTNYCYTVVAVYGSTLSERSNEYCTSTGSTMGIDETLESAYNVYPNPATDRVVIAGEHIKSVEVYNMLGQRVVSMNVAEKAELDVTAYESGMYIIRIMTNDDAVVTKRLMIAR